MVYKFFLCLKSDKSHRIIIVVETCKVYIASLRERLICIIIFAQPAVLTWNTPETELLGIISNPLIRICSIRVKGGTIWRQLLNNVTESKIGIVIRNGLTSVCINITKVYVTVRRVACDKCISFQPLLHRSVILIILIIRICQPFNIIRQPVDILIRLDRRHEREYRLSIYHFRKSCNLELELVFRKSRFRTGISLMQGFVSRKVVCAYEVIFELHI